MSKFFDPQPHHDKADLHRRNAPATERNRDVILEVMKAHVPPSGTLVEVASGTGQHATYIAPHLKGITWQPTDIEPANLQSIDAWRAHTGHASVLPAKYFDVFKNDFAELVDVTDMQAIAAINLIHIAPWAVAESLIQKAASALSTGILFLYGPYMRGGAHTSQSNADFDLSLKSRNEAWGIRALEDVSACAVGAGFSAPIIIEMPANNLSLIFRKS